MIDYSERREEKLGRIRLLEDTDGDGVFDKSDGLCGGIALADGGVSVEGGRVRGVHAGHFVF